MTSSLTRRCFLASSAAALTTGPLAFAASTDGGSATAHPAFRPFKVKAPQAKLDDLLRRIAATRWPSKEIVADASQGVQLATMRKLARYWATDYDWRRVEARLNALPQFITEIDGVDIPLHPCPFKAAGRSAEGYGSGAPVVSANSRAAVRSEAIAAAHAPNQNLYREAFIGSVIPEQYTVARPLTRQAAR